MNGIRFDVLLVSCSFDKNEHGAFNFVQFFNNDKDEQYYPCNNYNKTMYYSIKKEKKRGKTCYVVYNMRSKSIHTKCHTLKEAKKLLCLLKAANRNPSFIEKIRKTERRQQRRFTRQTRKNAFMR